MSFNTFNRGGSNTVISGEYAKSVFTGMALLVLFGGLQLGCVAQKADVARIQRDLEQQMGQIKSEKDALRRQAEKDRTAIVESQKLIAAQKADMSKIRRDIAPLHQKIELIEGKDLTSLYGKIELVEKQSSDLKNAFQAHKKVSSTTTERHKSDIQSIQATVQAHAEQLQAAQAKTTALAGLVDKSNQSITKELTDFQTAFGEFKRALTDIGTELTTETQRAASAEAQLSTDIISQVQQVSTELAAQEQALQTRSDDLSQSILQLQDTVKQSGMLFGARLDEQTAHQAELVQQLTSLDQQTTSLVDQQSASLGQQITSLQKKLDTDTQALRTFLEQDVKVAMAKLVTDMDDRQRPVVQSIDALQSDMEALGSHVQADATQVQELSRNVVQLREAQAVTGSLLGKRGDEIIQQAGHLSERMNAIETHQTTLTQQIQSNTKKTSTHLTKVNARLTSNAKRLDQTTQSFSQRLTQQDKMVASLNQGLQQLQQLQDKTKGQIQQLQAASQLADQLRQSVEQINARLQGLASHQSELDGTLDSEAQTTKTYLQEVNNGIHSIKQALESVSAKLNSRIANQEQQLNRAMLTLQSVQGAADVAQSNVEHLNDLTETMNQIREAFNTIKTKLGERVDEHEDRLGQLAQRVNHLGKKRKK